MNKEKDPKRQAAGSLGGKRILELKGKEYFSKLAKKMHKKRKLALTK